MRWQENKRTAENQFCASQSRVLSRFVALLLTFLSFETLAGGQQSAEDQSAHAKPEWTFNFSQAPLVITATSSKSYDLSNQSTTRIKKYHLGCVQLDTNKLPMIVYRMEPQEVDIGPGEVWGTMAFHRNPDRLVCEERNSKLSVVDVVFDNTTEWHAPTKHR